MDSFASLIADPGTAVQLLLGLVIGLVMALTGAGGGVLAVPLLVFGAGLAVTQAGPVALLAVGAAAAAGAITGLRAGIVRYRAALVMAGGGVLLAPLGVWLGHQLDERVLDLLFAAVLLWVAYRSLRPAPESELAGADSPACATGAESGRIIWTARCARILASTGSLAGMMSGLLGVGGGFVIVPALKRYAGLSSQSVIATSLAVIALVATSALIAATAAGRLDWTLGIPFCAGALAGMLAGRPLSKRLREPLLQASFAAVSAAVALLMVARAVMA